MFANVLFLTSHNLATWCFWCCFQTKGSVKAQLFSSWSRQAKIFINKTLLWVISSFPFQNNKCSQVFICYVTLPLGGEGSANFLSLEWSYWTEKVKYPHSWKPTNYGASTNQLAQKLYIFTLKSNLHQYSSEPCMVNIIFYLGIIYVAFGDELRFYYHIPQLEVWLAHLDLQTGRFCYDSVIYLQRSTVCKNFWR